MSRPIPDDFAVHAMRDGLKRLMVRYSASRKTVTAWIAASGIERPKLMGGTPMRPAPDDFADQQRGRTNSWLREHYNCGEDTITRWRKTLDLPAQRAAPGDFAERYAAMTIDQLRKHYGRGWSVIKDWIAELGLTRTAPLPKVVKAKVRPVRAAPAPFIRAAPEKRSARARLIAFHRAAPDALTRDLTPAGQAADFLRRFGPVYRCDDRGRPTAGGCLWRRGNAVMTDAELIQRADWMRARQAA